MGRSLVRSENVNHRRARFLSATLPVLAGLSVLSIARLSAAQITTDASFGKTAATLTGPNFLIPASLGQTRGGNLFQSFGQFNLATGESATFSGPSSINNVIARVTGGTQSNIDGTLSCTIANANVYLINPAGVVFGPNSQLNVSGSFAVTTAQVLRHSDGGTFDAQTPSNSVLSSAPPSAFGFLTPNAAPVTVQGLLAVPTGKVVSIVAGPISVPGGAIQAAAGRVNLISVASAGDVKLDPSDVNATVDTSGFSTFADMTLNAAGAVSTDGSGGGRVVVRAGKLVLDNDASILARTTGAQNGAGISVAADTVTVTNGSFMSAGTRAGASGNAGSIDITANSVTLDGADASGSRSGLYATSNGGATGNAGNVTIQTGSLTITNQAEIDVGSYTSGQGGNVNVTATSVLIDALGPDIFTGIYSESLGPAGSAGKGGNLSITTDTLTMNNQGAIATSVYSSGDGGNITINAKSIDLESAASIAAESNGGSGNAGNINVTTSDLTIRGSGNITGDTLGDPDLGIFTSGNGGNLSVTTKTALIDSQGAPGFTGIVSQSLKSTGAAGNISFHADSLTLQNGGEISSETLNGGPGGTLDVTANSIAIDSQNSSGYTGIVATVDGGSSNGGNIHVNTGRLSITNPGGEITAGTMGDGNAGNVTVTATGGIDITADGRLSVTTIGAGNAGALSVTAGGTINLLTGGQMLAASTAAGNAGSLTIGAASINLDGSNSATLATGIRAEALSTGLPGRIDVTANQIRVVNGAVIDSSSLGVGTNAPGTTGGAVTIQSGSLVVAGADSVIGAASGGATPGGNILINATSVAVSDGAAVTTQVSGGGGGGTITVNAQTVDVSSHVAAIKAITSGSGNGGDIAINAGKILIDNDAQIAASTIGTGSGGTVHISGESLLVRNGSVVDSTSTLSGSAGTVTIDDKHVHVTRKSYISSGATQSGNGSALTLNAASGLTLDRNSAITSNSVDSNGGDIRITSKGPIDVSRSFIFASAGIDAGSITIATAGTLDLFHGDITTQAGHDGGNITLMPRLASFNASFVSASAGHNGGNIHIQPQALLISAHTPITATGKRGVSGQIEVTAPDQTIASSIAHLPESLYTANLTLQPQCGQMTGMMNVSSFVISGRGGVPLSPDSWQVDFGVQGLADPFSTVTTKPVRK